MRLRSPDNSGYGKVTKQSTKRAEKSSITVSVERPSSGRGRGKRPRSGNLEKPRVGRHYTRSVERPSSRSGRGKRPSSRTSENFSSPSKRLSVEPTPKRQRTNLNSKLDSTPSSAPTTPTRKVLKSTNITQKKVAKESSKKKSPISLELGLGVENDNPNTQLSKESGAKEKEKNVVAVPVNNEGSENDDLMDENEWIELKNNTRVAGNRNIRRIIDYDTGFAQTCVVTGYPQRLRLQRRLYEIYTVCILILMIPYNRKLLSFFHKSLNKPFKGSILRQRLYLPIII